MLSSFRFLQCTATLRRNGSAEARQLLVRLLQIRREDVEIFTRDFRVTVAELVLYDMQRRARPGQPRRVGVAEVMEREVFDARFAFAQCLR